MTRRRRREKRKAAQQADFEKQAPQAEAEKPAEQAENQAAEAPGEEKTDGEQGVKVSGWIESERKVRRKSFPEGGPIDEPVRIAMSGEARVETLAHARESLDAEVCGVLVGELCEDDYGIWVRVEAAIRGSSTKQGGAHVTYTQETWEKIHEIKDRDYTKLNIVGWYHSHPGFGVEFSKMDTFIQEHFFAGPAQFALVLDPLSGDEAICVNTRDGIRHVSRFWVGGRQRTCRVPSAEPDESDEAGGEASGAMSKRLRAVEERLQQVLQAFDEDRMARHRGYLTVGMLIAVAVVLWISLMIYDRLFPSQEPPKSITFKELPVMIGDEPSYLGVQILGWKLPDSLHARWKDLIIEQYKAEQEAEQEEEGEAEENGQEAKEAGDKGQEEETKQAKTGEADQPPKSKQAPSQEQPKAKKPQPEKPKETEEKL